MLTTVDDLSGREPSTATFAELTRLLDGLRGPALDAAVARAEVLLAGWPDEARNAPDAWDLIQQEKAPPRWWTLVRHVRVESGETLDVGRALEPLASVDASDADVNPAPLAGAGRLRFLDLSGNQGIVDLRFLAGTPVLARLLLARPIFQLDLAPIIGLTQLVALDLSGMEGFSDAAILNPLRQLRWLNLSQTDCGATLAALPALPELATLLISECAGVTDFSWMAALPRLRELVARDLPNLATLTGLASESLHTLVVGGRTLTDLSAIGDLASLVDLKVLAAPKVRDLSFLSRLLRLRHLMIEGVKRKLPVLALPALESVSLTSTNLNDLEALGAARSLTYLAVNGGRLPDLSPLGALDRLDVLALTNCEGLGDLRPLEKLPLRLLDLTGSTPLPAQLPVRSTCQVIR